MMNLSKRVNLTAGLHYGSGAATRNGLVVDARGYQGVAFLVTVHSRTDLGTLTLKVQGGNAADLSDAVDLSSVTRAVPAQASVYDGVTFVFDLGHPQQRYLRVVAEKDGTNPTSESAVVARYNARRESVPVDEWIEQQFHHAPSLVEV